MKKRKYRQERIGHLKKDYLITLTFIKINQTMPQFICTLVLQMARRFPDVITREELGSLHDEVLDFQTSDIPEGINCTLAVDHFWGKMATVNRPGTTTKRFPHLSTLMKTLCILPHSNADCERTFSQVRHIKTDFRKSLLNKTLSNMLAIKNDALFKSSNIDLDAVLLAKAKRAVIDALAKEDEN